MSGWDRVKTAAASDPYILGIVEATLEEAMRQVREVQPAPSSRMTFEGGKTRAVGLIRKMRSEIRAPWTGRNR